LIHRLVFENLKHRPVRTLFSAIAIGVSVTMMLTLEGLSAGVLGDIKERSHGTGADILIRPPHSTVFSNSANMKLGEKIVALVRSRPHVAVATGTLVQSTGAALAARKHAEADAGRDLILAGADAAVARIRAGGEADAAAIYAQAARPDPDFFSFYRSLVVYRRSLAGKTILVLDADSPFLKYLKPPQK